MGHQAKVKQARREARQSADTPQSAFRSTLPAKRRSRSVGGSRDVVLKFKSKVGYWRGQTQAAIDRKWMKRA